MLAQEEKVRDAEAFGDEPCPYQEAMNSSEKSLRIDFSKGRNVFNQSKQHIVSEGAFAQSESFVW